MFTNFSQKPNVAIDHKVQATSSNPKPDPHGQSIHPASKSAPNSSTGTQAKATLTKKTLSPTEVEELQQKYEELEKNYQELQKKNIYLGFENRCLHDVLKKAALRRGLPTTFI